MCYQLVFIFISLKETNTCLYVYAYVPLPCKYIQNLAAEVPENLIQKITHSFIQLLWIQQLLFTPVTTKEHLLFCNNTVIQ